MIYKPQLLPNNKAGEAPDWEERIQDPENWLYSAKVDGARVALFANGRLTGRTLKPQSSVHINQMAQEVARDLYLPNNNIVLDAEFYAHDMTFSEIMHFFKSEDVTSAKSIAKYKKLWEKSDNGTNSDIWKFHGRDWQWLTTWHDSLKFHLFDAVDINNPNTGKMDRAQLLAYLYDKANSVHLDYIEQFEFSKIEDLYQAYDQALLDNYEGLVVAHKDSEYKFGRHTLNAKKIYKIKDDNIDYDGMIIDVLESTVAREGAPKTINELGRSVTSKLQEDRLPSGMAKGFLVRMEDGRELTVSLKDYNHYERTELLKEKELCKGKFIRFTGAAPVKVGGVPRHAHYTKGNLRDAK